jgi:hypothetical protein
MTSGSVSSLSTEQSATKVEAFRSADKFPFEPGFYDTDET